MKTSFLYSCGIFLIITISSCQNLAPFERPKLELPQETSTTSLLPISGTAWWTVFHNNELNRLEERALQYNYDLIHAAAIVDKAIALAAQTQSEESPQLGLKIGVTREELSKGQQFSQSLPTRQRDLWQASGILSYEVDLWGKLKAQTEAAQANILSSIAAQHAVALRLSAEVASAYIDICTWKEKCSIIQRVHDSYEQTCTMYEKRFEQGQYPELALRRVQAERAKTQAQLEKAKTSLALAESTLSVLIGDSPRTLMQREFNNQQSLLLKKPPAIPSGIPSNIIDRRPDLFELESRLKSAHFTKAAARANRLPSLSLTGAFGQISSDLEKVLNQPSRLYDMGGSILQSLFDGGKKRAILEATSAEYAATEAAYQQTVLVAFREIKDALIERKQSGEIYKATNDEVQRLRRSWDIASKQYDAGYIGLMDTLDTHRSLLNGELDMADSAQMRLNSIVKLCKALGGGWRAPQAN